ncbi:MAG: hypothetical protein AB1938_02315 [Myxococcota bacterium]
MGHDDSGTDKKPARAANADATVNDLPPVRTDATQLIDPLAASSPALVETDTDTMRAASTDRGLPPVPPTTTDLPPVPATNADLPPVPSGLDLTPAHPRPPPPEANAVTAPRLGKTRKPSQPPAEPPLGLTPARLVAIGVGVAVLFVLIWLVWPALTRPTKPPPVEWVDASPTAPTPAPTAPPRPADKKSPAPPPAPAADLLTLDAKRHVIDPRALHAPDVPLESTHKYRLTLKADDPRAGVVLARLEEKDGWGVLHKMATHHALQFGGARTLRLHCEPGTDVKADTVLTLELEDLARKAQRKTLTISPATECFDFEVARLFDLEPGQSRRLLLRSEQTAKLGEQTPLRVAYRLLVPGDAPRWRFGVLTPGDDVLVQGPGARFAILDPYLGDNEGSVALQILPGDTDSKGLVRPDSTDSKFVPNRP